MPNNDINQRWPSSFNEIQNLYDQISNKAENYHIRGNIRGIYARQGNPPKSPGYFDRRSFADARSQIRSIISKYLGSEKQTNQIFKDVLGNSKGMNTRQLGDILGRSREFSTSRQVDRLKRLKPEQANRLIENIDKKGSKYSEWSPQVKGLVRLAAKKDSSAELTNFLDAAEKYNQRFTQWEKRAGQKGFELQKNGELVDRENNPVDLNTQPELKEELLNIGEEAKAIRERFVEKSKAKEYNLNSREKRQAKAINIPGRMRDQLMDNTLTSAVDLKDAFAPCEEEVIRLLTNDVVPRLSKLIGSDYVPAPDEKLDFATLESIELQMKGDDHLRFEENRLYTKSSHPGVDSPRFFNRNHSKVSSFSRGRGAKFASAKRTVQASITDLLKQTGVKDGEALARQIMQPYLSNSNQSLTKADLSKIISSVRTKVNAHNNISRVLDQSGTKPLPSLNELVSQSFQQKDSWSSAFFSYTGHDSTGELVQCNSLSKLAQAIEDNDEKEIKRLANNWCNSRVPRPRSLQAELGEYVNAGANPTNIKALQNEVLAFREQLVKNLQEDYDEFNAIAVSVQSQRRQKQFQSNVRAFSDLNNFENEYREINE